MPSSADLVRLTNGVVDLEISTAFGPRILRYGFVDEANVLASVPDLITETPIGPWRPIGGHRLWVAPERMPGSYAPDMAPVSCDRVGEAHAMFRSAPDASGIEKALHVDVGPGGTAVAVTHAVTNRTLWPVRVAPWAITVTVTDGTAVMPHAAYRSHADDMLPARRLALWAYTDLSDPRWRIGRRLLALTPDPARASPQKIGAGNEQGWCALVRRAATFVKQVTWDPGGEYPDLGSNIEFFTAGDYLELETLAPLRLLEPGETSTHVERWALLRGLDPDAGESAIEAAIVAALPSRR